MADSRRLTIDGFRIIAPIGVGASSTVYVAVDEATGGQVALKVLADNHSLHPERRHRFLQEVELLDAVDSRAVARIHGVGETAGGQLYMVLDLADRGDLRHRFEELRAAGRTPGRADLLALGRHLADALSGLHRAGIVHRDVSPGNILIRSARLDGPDEPAPPAAPAGGLALLEPDERFLLADLGFAKDLAFASGLTAGGGTRGFAAPEQRGEVTVVDERADVFSATAVIEWAARDAGLDDDLDPFLDAGLADDPADRPATMDDWFQTLSSALTGSAGADGPPSPWAALADEGLAVGAAAGGSGDPRWRRVARSRWAVAAAGGLAVLAAVLIVAVLNGGSLLSGRTTTDDPGRAEVAALADDAGAPGDSTANGAELTGATAIEPAAATATLPGVGEPGTAVGSGGAPGPSGGPTATAPAATSPTATSPTAPGATGTPTAGPAPTGNATTAPTPGPTHEPTTTEPRLLNSARAYIRVPVDGGTASGSLTISGDAVAPVSGVTGVYIAIRNLDTGLYWHDDTGAYAAEYVRFPWPVTPSGGTPATWSYTVPAGKLVPGRYNVRVWARSPTGNDPLGNEAFVTVS